MSRGLIENSVIAFINVSWNQLAHHHSDSVFLYSSTSCTPLLLSRILSGHTCGMENLPLLLHGLFLLLILEDIRRTTEHASDIAEAAMNETVSEVIEKIPRSEAKAVAQ